MEHIVQFGISIDDSAIARRIEENAYQAVLGNVKNEMWKSIKENIRQKGYGWRYDGVDWSEFAKPMVKEIIEEHEGEILAQALESALHSMRGRKTTKAVAELARSVAYESDGTFETEDGKACGKGDTVWLSEGQCSGKPLEVAGVYVTHGGETVVLAGPAVIYPETPIWAEYPFLDMDGEPIPVGRSVLDDGVFKLGKVQELLMDGGTPSAKVKKGKEVSVYPCEKLALEVE